MVLKSGKGSFIWDDKTGRSDPDKPLEIHYYRPKKVTADTPVWIVAHGQGRNAANYRDFFIEAAAAQGALVIVPEFNAVDWKGRSGYNLGNIATDGLNPQPILQQDWSFSKIEPLFDFVVDTVEPTIKAKKYDLFGHSAGAQLVHRFMAWVPDNRVNLAVAANAGSYAIPQSDKVGYQYSWPYSTVGTPDNNPKTSAYDPFPVSNIDSYLASNMVVLVGGNDTKRNKSLPKTREADAQGRDRVERAKYFFAEGRSEATTRKVDFNWDLQIVDNVGHDGRKMAAAAAQLFQKADADTSHPGTVINKKDLVWEDLGLQDEAAVASNSTVKLGDSLTTTIKWDIEKVGKSKFVPQGGDDFVSYEKDSLGKHRGYLNLGFDNSENDPRDKVKLSIVFNQAVTGLNFDVLDVDSNAYFDDGVEVFVDGVNIRETPDMLTLGGSRVKFDDEDYLNGFEGNGSTGKFGTASNINISMGSRSVSSVDIFYDSTDDARSNPIAQTIGISDLHWT